MGLIEPPAPRMNVMDVLALCFPPRHTECGPDTAVDMHTPTLSNSPVEDSDDFLAFFAGGLFLLSPSSQLQAFFSPSS
jgi:hypothetical protein